LNFLHFSQREVKLTTRNKLSVEAGERSKKFTKNVKRKPHLSKIKLKKKIILELIPTHFLLEKQINIPWRRSTMPI